MLDFLLVLTVKLLNVFCFTGFFIFSALAFLYCLTAILGFIEEFFLTKLPVKKTEGIVVDYYFNRNKKKFIPIIEYYINNRKYRKKVFFDDVNKIDLESGDRINTYSTEYTLNPLSITKKEKLTLEKECKLGAKVDVYYSSITKKDFYINSYKSKLLEYFVFLIAAAVCGGIGWLFFLFI